MPFPPVRGVRGGTLGLRDPPSAGVGRDLDFIAQGRGDAVASEPALDGHGPGLIGGRREGDMSVGHGKPMGRIVGAPAEPRNERLGPGVKMSSPVGRIRTGLIAAHEPGRHAEAPAGGEEQDGHVAAGAVAELERLLGRTGWALGANVMPDLREKRLVQAVEEGERRPGARRRELEGEGAERAVDLSRGEIGRVRPARVARPRQSRRRGARLEFGAKATSSSNRLSMEKTSERPSKSMRVTRFPNRSTVSSRRFGSGSIARSRLTSRPASGRGLNLSRCGASRTGAE